MAKTTYNRDIAELNGGINLDVHPSNQPKGTRRYTLNAVEETVDGQQHSVSNELSAEAVSSLPEGYTPIGNRYMVDGQVSVILTTVDGITDIGIVDSDDKYRSFVNTATLGTRINKQAQIEFRIRRGKERVIYWVDSHNKPRTFNYDRIYNFYTIQYQAYLKAGGDPNTYPADKWDGNSFDLIKSYNSVPTFNSVQIIEYGSILPGSYNFAIQYVDEDLNPTEWITTSNTVNIFNDSINSPFERIRGSRNIQSESQSFPRASKSVRLTLGNMDNSFPYYRIAIIRAAGNTGLPEKVLVSDVQSTYNSVFVYSGNDGALTETSLEDILIDKQIIFAPKHITQLENRLQLANYKGKGINWCEFQRYASKIRTDLTTEPVILNSVFSDPNVKNANHTFRIRGYMPGEVYSFGIVYLFSDGYLSPVFHIPGKNSTDTTSLMAYHELSDNRYIDIHNCVSDYWGRDAEGETLNGKLIRHHKFPTRREVGKPLVTTNSDTTDITRYRLRLKISLNPAHTPEPEYPQDVDGNPLVLGYTFSYKVLSQPTDSEFNGTMVDTDVGRLITVYDDTQELEFVTGTQYLELETSPISDYITGLNPNFIYEEFYEEYTLTSVQDTDESEIFGIEFFEIERPHPDVVGFYIVRNERTDDDKTIVDNAIIGPMTEYQNYKSFGLIMPKQFYHASNCGNEADAGKTLDFYERGVWFFNPEFQYLQKKMEFDHFYVEGEYSTTSVNMPTISNVDGQTCNRNKSKGVYIDDVQAGTSYNPDINKSKDADDDGFDLLVGYRNSNIAYGSDDYTFPDKDRVFYLNAASYQNDAGNTLYNTSVDNKIGIYTMPDDYDTAELVGATNKLKYASMVKNNTTSYSNFVNREYFKEHNNAVMFSDGDNFINEFRVFNGDTAISGFNFISSVFYDMVVADRAKKSGLWKIIAGAVLVVAGIVLTVVGGAGIGLTALGVSVLSGLAISYGISLAVSGFKFEQFKAMVDVDYEKGLKETVVDGGVFETIRDTIERDDDTIRWFSDRVSNIYMESSVPFGLRTGLTTGVTDFVDAPAQYNEEGFRTYLIEKFTTIDREQGSGRLYKGYATSEVYDMNLDYMRFNKEKRFSHLALEYDCCSDPNEEYPTRVTWSEQAFQEERTDNYRSFLPNNYVDIEGIHGEITNMYRLGNSLFIHTEEALWQLPKNNQERVTDEIVSFIGTGNYFSILPQLVVDDDMGSAGTKHKWASIKTPAGMFFISESDRAVYLHSNKIENISQRGLRNWFKEFTVLTLEKQLYDTYGVTFENSNNPANPNGIGFHAVYDERYNRYILTKKNYLIATDKLASLVIVNTTPISGEAFAFNTENSTFYNGIEELSLTNGDFFENKSYTISFSLHSNTWCSWHSYLPNAYIQKSNGFYSFDKVLGGSQLWMHNIGTSFQRFYNIVYPHILEIVKKQGVLGETSTEDLRIACTARVIKYPEGHYLEKRDIFFNSIVAFNERQSTGEQLIIVSNTLDSDEYMAEQIKDHNDSILAVRLEKDWFLNNLVDYVDDYEVPLFTSDWQSIRAIYPIDKVPNVAALNLNKDWWELESFRDKYIIFRLKFDNFDNVNLLTRFAVTTEQGSVR